MIASFNTDDSPIIIPGITDCNQRSNLILNMSTPLIATFCDYCRNRRPCIIKPELLNLYSVFATTNFNSKSLSPFNIAVFYECLSWCLFYYFLIKLLISSLKIF